MALPHLILPAALALLGLARPALAQAPAPAVTVLPAAQACLVDRVPFIGTLAAREDVLVIPLLEGARVTEVLAAEGDRVSGGQALARLAPPGPPGESPPPIDVTAPAGGIVLARSARVGLVASPASPEPLFRIARDGAADVVTALPAARVARVAAGQAVRLRAPAGEIGGQVRHVAPELDRQSRLALVRIAPEGDPRLPFGASIAGTIEAGRACGLTVPTSALLAEGGRTLVRRVRDGRVESVPVETGLVEGDRVEIRTGLAAGDLVVARAGAFLRDGDVVRPLTPGQAP